jgi:hypothetical protein
LPRKWAPARVIAIPSTCSAAAARARAEAAKAAPTRKLGKLERAALADLDLDEDADGARIRARYTELVKRCRATLGRPAKASASISTLK